MRDCSFHVGEPLAKCDEEKKTSFTLECVDLPGYFLKNSHENLVIGKLNGSFDDNMAATWIIETGKFLVSIQKKGVWVVLLQNKQTVQSKWSRF